MIKRTSRQHAVSIVSVVVVVAGYLLFAYDEQYGPKDNVICLWVFPVMLVMLVAACVLFYQAAALIFRVLRRAL